MEEIIRTPEEIKERLEEMTKAENMAEYQTPWTVYCSDFNDVTGQEEVFSKGFDLSISTMSPAIHDAETIRKMSAVTRGWCFLSRFYDWQQPLRDALMREMGMELKQLFDDLKSNVEAMIQTVGAAGYTPLVKIVDYNWSDRRTPEQMAAYMRNRYFSEEKEAELLYAKALSTAEKLSCGSGFVDDTVNTKVAWIYWETKGK